MAQPDARRSPRARARSTPGSRLRSLDVEALRAAAGVTFADGRRRLDPRGWPRWVLGVLLLAVPSQALAAWRVLGDLPAGTRPPMLDSIIFEYVGWYLTVGARLYVDVWDLKPPLPYEMTAGLALLAGGDPWRLHLLAVLVSSAAAVGTALLAGALVDDLTGDGVAAVAAAASVYVFPAFHWRAAYGFKPKYVVALCLLGAVYLAHRERHAGAGVLAGVAAASWQLAVVVPLLAVGLAFQRGGRRAAGRSLLAAIGVVALSLLPVVYWGAVEAMVTEVVLVPLLVSENLTTLEQLTLLQRFLGVALPVAALGLVGVADAARRRPRAAWWLATATAWFGLAAVFLDLDGPPDLFPLVALLAVGLGVLLGSTAGDQRPAAALVVLLAVATVVTAGGFAIGPSPLRQPDAVPFDPADEVRAPYEPDERAHLFWASERPTTCRVFFGPTQFRLTRLDGKSATPEHCGQAGPVVDALRERWGL